MTFTDDDSGESSKNKTASLTKQSMTLCLNSCKILSTLQTF